MTKKQMIDRILALQNDAENRGQLSDTAPEGIPDEVWKKIILKINFTERDEIVYRVWENSFSQDELKAIYDFYASSTGQKFVKSLTNIMQDVQLKKSQWYRKQLLVVLSELKDQGYTSPSLQKEYDQLERVSVLKQKALDKK